MHAHVSLVLQIAGRRLVVYSDNTGAEAATRSGSARSFDHACMTHAMWKKLALIGTALWVHAKLGRWGPSCQIAVSVCVDR